MPEPADPSPSHATAGDVTIVLLLPDAVRGAEDAVLKTLNGAERPIRVLLCLADDHQGNEFVAALEAIGVETQILLGPKVAEPAAKTIPLRAPPDMVDKDLKEFALALSDVVLMVAPSASDSEAMKLFKETVKDLEKLTAAPGAAMAYPDALGSATHNLDPDIRGWRAAGRRVFGRLEQAILEIFAFAWLGSNKRGLVESAKQLRKCISWKWRPRPYFAPEGWQDLAPDRSALEGSKIVARFDAMDRSALHGSYIHRDFIWIVHLGGAFAVLAAVAGHLSHGGLKWSILELSALVLVAVLALRARRTTLQANWTACRLGAEQLRIARMSLPLLVLPQAMATSDRPTGKDHGGRDTELSFLALAEVKRAVRDHGLPRLAGTFAPADAARWLHWIVADQINYHHRNHHKLERAESRLHLATQTLFVTAMVAVVVHFFLHAEWLLHFTVTGFAFESALHGAGTRLGLVYRAALSLDVERELARIDKSLVGLVDARPSQENWRAVRRLAYEATEIMGRENTSWHGLVRRYSDELR